jgi:hypothetical protein
MGLRFRQIKRENGNSVKDRNAVEILIFKTPKTHDPQKPKFLPIRIKK